MALLKPSLLLAVWVASLVAVGLWGQARTVSAQPSHFPLYTGSDFGFRVDQMKLDPTTGSIQGTPRGTFVVRINGVWYEASAK
jgi:hypothetical protein